MNKGTDFVEKRTTRAAREGVNEVSKETKL